MRILSRYIAREFIGWLFVGLTAFVLIFIVVDSVDHLNRFMDSGFTAIRVAKYYLYYIPYIVLLMLPMVMLLSSLFCLGGMARQNELVAMKASGMSLYRILSPVFFIGIIASLISLVFAEVVVPRTNQRRMEIRHGTSRSDKSKTIRKDVFLSDGENRLVFAKVYDPVNETAADVSIEEYDGSSLIRRITGKKMFWRDNRWEVREGIIREFSGEQENITQFESRILENFLVVPMDFIREYKKPEEMNYFELKRYIERATNSGKEAGKWLVDLHLKISYPLTNFMMVLLGAPMASSVGRRTGKAASFGITILISFVFYGFIKGAQALGHNGYLQPLLAAWIGNIIFITVGTILLIKTRK